MLGEATAAIFGFIVFLFLYVKYKNRDLPPGPWGLPIVGYLPWLDPKNPHKTLTELSVKYGPIYSMQMGSIFAGREENFINRDGKELRCDINWCFVLF